MNSDIVEICKIYNYYIKNTVITFEENPLDVAELEDRIYRIISNFPFYVFEENEKILGYTYADKWQARCAYRYSVESTIYVRNGKYGKGIGTTLYKKLLQELYNLNFHSVIAGIALPNLTSQRLHEKFGFVKVAHFTEVGFKFNKWIDVGYWELIL